MAKEWNFLSNPFLHATDGSYINGMKISTFHDSALANVSTDQFFGPIYTDYHPRHMAYQTAYDAWVSQGTIQISETLNLSQLLSLLSGSKIDQWDVAIQNVYSKKTVQYAALLAHHRVPFQHGKQEEIIEAVKSLGTNLTGITALASVKTDVDNFYNQLTAANTTQKSGKQSKTVNIGSLETARIAICNSQYATLGLLINHFSTTPDNIAAYFDLDTIRTASQVHFTGHLKPLTQHCVCKHTFTAADSIKIKNKSSVALHVYLSSAVNAAVAKTIAPVAQPVIVAANTTETVKATQLGDLSSTNLMISNPDAAVTAQWELTIE
jgi:hypothetical protein